MFGLVVIVALVAAVVVGTVLGHRYRVGPPVLLGFDDAASDEMTEGLAVVSDLSGPARWFLDHARVALSSGHVFGIGGAGHVRINFATSRAILIEAVSRMSRSLLERR